jgi:hypothetical protein
MADPFLSRRNQRMIMVTDGLIAATEDGTAMLVIETTMRTL